MDAKAAQSLPFRFIGTGTQYFGIWIVNLLLMIITLGLYAPWAKVRKQQFFYSHTELAGERFDYTGDPWAILRGRLIAVAVLVVLNILEAFNPAFLFLTFAVIMLGMPWLIQRAMRFNAYNSRYRNLRLRFDGGLGEAFLIYVVLLIPCVLLFPLFPYWMYRHKRYLHSHLGYGNHGFRFQGRLRDFYSVYIESFLLGLGVLVLVVAAAALIGGHGLKLLEGLEPGQMPDGATLVALLPLLALALFMLPILYFVLVVYVRIKLTNLCWSYTSVGRNRFRSQMHVGQMAWIYFSNQLLVMLSLGLFTPWAQVRMARYRLESTRVDAQDDIESFMAGAQGGVSAAGEEMADVFGVDIAL